ncbi:hypothetical protein ABK905_17420 [Acerihabitans sp. KWT182]|uniref:Cellulose synthase operon protein C n=1 Tax=Acerihabitans sp. KWT182 TaxID=3157919 RepID=A0AAU7Q609_9GAMM
MNNKKRNVWIGGTLCLGSALGMAPYAFGADNDPAVRVLLDQATYWHQKSHDDLAKAALQKVFQVDAGNITAVYMMALYSSQNGDEKEAEKWRQKLMALSPNDPRLASLAGEQRLKAVSPAQLAEARKLAAAGNVKAAVAAYQALFNGSQPIDSLALEYYMTMAGSADSLPEAVAGLRQRAGLLPQDTDTQLALAKVLTYQPSTRREGSEKLAALADGNKEADQALRQSLLWMTPQPDDADVYQKYLQRHADDNAVLEHYRQGLGGGAKQSGYTALNSGDLAGAREKIRRGAESQSQRRRSLGRPGLRQHAPRRLRRRRQISAASRGAGRAKQRPMEYAGAGRGVLRPVESG